MKMQFFSSISFLLVYIVSINCQSSQEEYYLSDLCTSNRNSTSSYLVDTPKGYYISTKSTYNLVKDLSGNKKGENNNDEKNVTGSDDDKACSFEFVFNSETFLIRADYAAKDVDGGAAEVESETLATSYSINVEARRSDSTNGESEAGEEPINCTATLTLIGREQDWAEISKTELSLCPTITQTTVLLSKNFTSAHKIEIQVKDFTVGSLGDYDLILSILTGTVSKEDGIKASVDDVINNDISKRSLSDADQNSARVKRQYYYQQQQHRSTGRRIARLGAGIIAAIVIACLLCCGVCFSLCFWICSKRGGDGGSGMPSWMKGMPSVYRTDQPAPTAGPDYYGGAPQPAGYPTAYGNTPGTYQAYPQAPISNFDQPMYRNQPPSNYPTAPNPNEYYRN
ncbi:unnamed protein product [Gordionus sp. m RMFG-2023]